MDLMKMKSVVIGLQIVSFLSIRRLNDDETIWNPPCLERLWR